MIHVRNLERRYRVGAVDVQALRNATFTIAQGEFVAITGASGSGKSTLMHILGLLDRADGGHYRLAGQDTAALSERERAAFRARFIGFVFQQFNLLPRASAEENVALPLIYSDHPEPADPSTLLERVGLSDRRCHTPAELSGGQQQRVAIARALVNRPPILLADEPTGNLDSQSSAEIMDLLKQLHREGMTVILVTHDPDIATQADRRIHLHDGCVAEDTGPAGARKATRIEPDLGRRPWTARLRRRFFEGVLMCREAGRAMRANRARTFLSILGVLIGVAALIWVMGISHGAQDAVEQRIAAMGANVMVVRPGRVEMRGIALGAGAVSRLTLDNVDMIESVPGVVRAAPTVSGHRQVTARGKNWRTRVIGTTPAYADMHDRHPAFGRFISEDDVRHRRRVAVLGTEVVRELFDGGNPIGETVRIDRAAYTVVGLLDDSGLSFFGVDQNDQILIPVTTAMWRLFGRRFVDSIEIEVIEAAWIHRAEDAVRTALMRAHRIPAGQDGAFMFRNITEIQRVIQETSQTMELMGALLGIVSLLVGGIGIMNIMLVSVTERTREIGLRKAIGARQGDLLAQFLIESTVVSLLGGALGIVLGFYLAHAVGHWAEWMIRISPVTVTVAFFFSACVGVIFGFSPARKAARLDPIQALRYE